MTYAETECLPGNGFWTSYWIQVLYKRRRIKKEMRR